MLAESAGKIFFEYDPAFLASPLWLSPFKLPPRSGLIEHRERDFGPLPGLFDDSLPDGWGLLVMDRYFSQQGLRPAEIGALERLAFLGTRTMGALTYHPPQDDVARAPQALALQELANAAAEVLRGSSAEILPQLVRTGGSPGGARPKVLVGIKGDEMISGEGDLPPGFEAWMVKFPSGSDDGEAGRIEETYAHMAREAGIEMPPSRLFETPDGGCYFGVQRFDRADGRRLHVHTFGNLIHADFRLPSCDYEQLLEVTKLLTRRQKDVVQQFRRMVFNVASHNRDDHAKNFAFRMSAEGDWQLSPAYDLVFAEGPGGEHTTSVAGEGKAPTRRHLLALAEKAGVAGNEAEKILAEVTLAVAGWKATADAAGIRPNRSQEIDRAIHGCLGRLS